MHTKVFLAQTDTTVGFLSKSYKKLNEIKKRPLNTPCIKVVDSLSELTNHVRVPIKHKSLVRRAKKTSFIYPNAQSLRVVFEGVHQEFLSTHTWLYSTSANLTGKDFDERWARDEADEVEEVSFSQESPSKIVRLGRIKKQRIR